MIIVHSFTVSDMYLYL